MKKILGLVIIIILSAEAFSQGELENAFYFRFGYSQPTKQYWGIDDPDYWENGAIMNGFITEIGHIFIIDQPLAEGLRMGVNVDYLAFYYHKIINRDVRSGHVLFGSKVGPCLSYSPVDKLVFDIYGKFNPVWISTLQMTPLTDDLYEDESEFFMGFLGIGFSGGINIRYSVFMFGFDFNQSWNRLNYISGSNSDYEYDDHFGNQGTDAGDQHRIATPMPSLNFTMGLAF